MIYIYEHMFFRYLLLFFVILACSNSTGFKQEPSNKDAKNLGLEQNGVTLKFYNLN